MNNKSIFIIIIIISISDLCALDPSFLRSSTSLHRSSFPQDFRFGAGSSAYQSEGAADVDGREPSIWDTFAKQHPEKIYDGSNGDVADEFYYRFKEDVTLMKEIGLDSFRLSISWSRILPRGKIAGGVNQAGINFYNLLINELISNGIRPLVTLFHWDTPQALEDEYGGFLNPQIVKDFIDYVDICFKAFGDRVKQWITINEPNMFAILGYSVGKIAPGRCSSYVGNCTAGNSATEPYLVAHYLILSHAAAVQLYREKYQSFHGAGTIGMTIQTYWMIPKNNTPACKEAAKRALDFMFGWFADPITYGDYPKMMRELVGKRLPKFTEKQSKMVRGSFDFLGVNYYTSRYVEDVMFYANTNLSYTTDSRVNQTTEKNGIYVGRPTSADWLFIYPKGFQDLLLYVKLKYQNPVILVTENGMPSENDKSSLKKALNDETKIKYHKLHLSALLEAVKQGADVRGFYIWSLMDDFEWYYGYKDRFGLVYVDFQDGLKRYLKSSALWYHQFLSNSSSYLMD